jgi:hypothetical protein
MDVHRDKSKRFNAVRCGGQYFHTRYWTGLFRDRAVRRAPDRWMYAKHGAGETAHAPVEFVHVRTGKPWNAELPEDVAEAAKSEGIDTLSFVLDDAGELTPEAREAVNAAWNEWTGPLTLVRGSFD